MDLLGSDVAQNDPNFLLYAVNREDLVKRLGNPSRKLFIINAARGSGKSGLLLSHEANIKEIYDERHLVIKKYNEDAPYPTERDNIFSVQRLWKITLLIWALRALHASGVDSGRVELTSLTAIKNRYVSSAEWEADPDDLIAATLEIVKLSGRTYWFLLDEMDDNYDNSASIKTKLMALFKSALWFNSVLPNAIFRITIRPHIMTILMTDGDFAQKLRENLVSLSWTEEGLMKILAARITRYDDLESLPAGGLFGETERHELSELAEILNRYFEPFDIGFKRDKQKLERKDYRALNTISLSRPRWMIEFCKLALEISTGDKATIEDYRRAMADYGRNRIQFLMGEFKAQIDDLGPIIQKMASLRKPSFGTSEQLRSLIVENIVQRGLRPVSQNHSAPEVRKLEDTAALRVANELYMVEFIRGKQSTGGQGDDHRFYTFRHDDSLLSTWDISDNITWEIHPAFAFALNVIETGTYRVGDQVRLFRDKKRRRSPMTSKSDTK